MKQLIYSLLLGTMVAFSSCESKMDEKHNNPDAFTSAEIPYLFSKGVLKAVENDYGDTYTYNFRRIANYIQVTARQEGKDRINLYQNIQDDLGRWENYYVTRMSTLTEIDKIYGTLSPTEQKEFQNYVEAGKIIQVYNTAIATDFFGNMPYSEAFTARDVIYGGSVIFKPKYDAQKDLYYNMLGDLKTAATFFKTATNDDVFKLQDIIYSGDCQKWYKFANSLRLRYAMRISNVDAAKAKEVLSELSLDQLITDNADNAYISVDENSTAVDEGIWRAIKESHTKSQGYYLYAPELMVNKMKGANDPRMQVYFQSATDDEGLVFDENQEIIGYPASADKAIALVNGPDGKKLNEIYGSFNAVTFRNNHHLPVGIGMTAAETYFCLAEAAQRGLFNGNAEEFYNKGIILSIQNYYTYYANSNADKKIDSIAKTDVSDTTLKSWLTSSSYKYNPSNGLEQIATQKWMHLGILQIYENWAEYRRTDLPVLDDDRENSTLLNKENAPVRFLYPSKEASMNTENYNAQSEYNKIDARLWWDVK